MKYLKYPLMLVLIFPILVSGCTGGRFTVIKDASDNEGFRYYLPKPYLLVSNKVDENTKTINREAKIIYLPDIDEKYSISVVGGTAGTFEGSLKFQDGWMLSEVDQKYDTKTAETIAAISSLIKELKPPEKLGEVPPFELYEIDLKTRKLLPLKFQ